MESESNADLGEAIDLLQQLGLKEYEARCFVGLSRVESGTAKQLSELAGVPRTRVYDAIRALEAQGLVEIHHSSPQRFRAVPLDEAVETIRDQYEARVERVEQALVEAKPTEVEDQSAPHQVWSMTGKEAIENRTRELIGNATDEVVLVVGDESLLTAELLAILGNLDDSVDLVVGSVTERVEDRVSGDIPEATTFVTELEWLDGVEGDDMTVGRLMLVDRSTILVSSIKPALSEEHAIFGDGFQNGLVMLARRVLVHGLLTD